MDKLARELEAARDELSPQWNAERSARLYAGTLQRKRRRTVRSAAVASVTIAAAAGLIALGVQKPGAKPEAGAGSVAAATRVATPPAAERSGHTLRLADGSFAELVGARSELEVMHNSAAQVGLKLLSGRAHFEVVHDPMRSFIVEAEPYRVEVIGTIFDVERSAHEVKVGVARGRVRVYGPQGAYDVVAGQTQGFELPARPAEAEPAALERTDEEREPQAARSRARGRRAGGLPGWRSLSQSGQYDAAFASLSRGESVEDDPSALMDAADAARLSGHPQSALQYLERVVRSHRKSPVAPLAAFTLGRVYLDELGQPDGAAEAFELSRKLAPNGSLAQDALAREVEALSKGGNARKAYVRAQEYLERYPNGRRVRAVQLYGGL